MVIKSHEPAKDRNKQNRENKNRVKKVIDTGKEKGITLETPKTGRFPEQMTAQG